MENDGAKTLNRNKVTETGGDGDGPQSWWEAEATAFCNLNLNHLNVFNTSS